MSDLSQFSEEQLEEELNKRRGETTSTWGQSGSCPYDEDEQTTTPIKKICGPMTLAGLNYILELMDDIKNTMNKYQKPPLPTEESRIVYAKIRQNYHDMNEQLVEQCSPDKVDKTPHKTMTIRDAFTPSSTNFYIYTVGYNHGDDGTRDIHYRELTKAITTPGGNNTFYVWQQTKNAMGPGPPWKPENFQIIWKYGKIPKNAQKAINILNRGKTWEEAYGSILSFGDYCETKTWSNGKTQKLKQTCKMPDGWVLKFKEVFEIRHLRKLGMNYDGCPFDREKGYSNISWALTGFGTSKSYHSLREFNVSWSKAEKIRCSQKYAKKLKGKFKKIDAYLRYTTSLDVEHSFHKEFFELGSMLNQWNERLISRFVDSGYDEKELLYHTKYEYIVNMSYNHVQEVINDTTLAWLTYQNDTEPFTPHETDFDTPLQIEKGERNERSGIKYLFEDIIWNQMGGNTTYEKLREMHPSLGENIEDFEKEIDEANNSLKRAPKDNIDSDGRKSPRIDGSMNRNIFGDSGEDGNFMTKFIKLKF